MDRYDRFILDILRKTEARELDWRVVPPGEISHAVLNPDRILRAYLADYPLQGRNYRLYFIEKRVEFLNEFAGPYREVLGFEVVVLDVDEAIVLTLYNGVVEAEDLWKLSSLIKACNDRAEVLLSAFDDTDAA